MKRRNFLKACAALAMAGTMPAIPAGMFGKAIEPLPFTGFDWHIDEKGREHAVFYYRAGSLNDLLRKVAEHAEMASHPTNNNFIAISTKFASQVYQPRADGEIHYIET